MDIDEAVARGGSETLALSPTAAAEPSTQPSPDDGGEERPRDAGVGSSDGRLADESAETHETGRGGHSQPGEGEGQADLKIVNEKLRAENEAFRMTIDANVSLKNNVNRLESSADKLEADNKALLAQLEGARRRFDEQLTLIGELERSLAGANEPHGEGSAEGQVGVLPQLDANAGDSHEQKVKDLEALISQLNEDAKVKAVLLEKKEAQLQVKRAYYEDLKQKHGRLQSVPLQSGAETVSTAARNPTSRSCLVM